MKYISIIIFFGILLGFIQLTAQEEKPSPFKYNFGEMKPIDNHTKVVYTRHDGSQYELYPGKGVFVETTPSKGKNIFNTLFAAQKHRKVVYRRHNGEVYTSYDLRHWKEETGVKHEVFDKAPQLDKKDEIEGVEEFTIFPNPTTGKTHVRFVIDREFAVKLCFFTQKREIVTTIIDQTYSPGEYEIVFDAGKFGIDEYIYTCNFGKQTINGVFSVIK
jgi:hypothetical protein